MKKVVLCGLLCLTCYFVSAYKVTYITTSSGEIVFEKDSTIKEEIISFGDDVSESPVNLMQTLQKEGELVLKKETTRNYSSFIFQLTTHTWVEKLLYENRHVSRVEESDSKTVISWWYILALLSVTFFIVGLHRSNVWMYLSLACLLASLCSVFFLVGVEVADSILPLPFIVAAVFTGFGLITRDKWLLVLYFLSIGFCFLGLYFVVQI